MRFRALRYAPPWLHGIYLQPAEIWGERLGGCCVMWLFAQGGAGRCLMSDVQCLIGQAMQAVSQRAQDRPGNQKSNNFRIVRSAMEYCFRNKKHTRWNIVPIVRKLHIWTLTSSHIVEIRKSVFWWYVCFVVDYPFRKNMGLIGWRGVYHPVEKGEWLG